MITIAAKRLTKMLGCLIITTSAVFAQGINQELPDPPSIFRNLNQADSSGPNGSLGRSLEDRHGDHPSGSGMPLPYVRQTIDGRLLYQTSDNWSNYPSDQNKNILGAGGIIPTLMYVDPENYGVGSVSKSENPVSTAQPVHPIVYFAFHPKLSYANPNKYAKNFTPPTYHSEICNDTGDVESPTRSCKAFLDESKQTVVAGDCYNVTLINFFENVNELLLTSEIRSSKVTIFIADAKLTGRKEKIYIYPRENISATLPPLTRVANWSTLGVPDLATSNLKLLTDACVTSNGDMPSDWQQRPYYCRFIYNQKVSHGITVDGVGYSAPIKRALFEPSITGDGKVLFLNIMGGGSSPDGIHYSYSNSSCDISKWNTFKKLSRFPSDAQVKDYPLAASPFRDGTGRLIPAGESLPGAYLWVDRKAKNIFFAAINQANDRFKDLGGNVINTGAGHGYVVMGAWTTGKMITLDGNLNLTDFGHNSKTPATISMNLYKGAATSIRPTSVTMIGSSENVLNNYNAFAPTVPFDVVWRIASNNQKNSDVIFDDYITPHLLLGTHMSAPMASYSANNNRYYYRKDGYFPSNTSGASGWSASGEPYLQNIASHVKTIVGNTVPESLKLIGGARVEPVALGGPLGKGVFLDGVNDAIYTKLSPGISPNNLVFNLWIDPRNLSDTFKTLFVFPGPAHSKIKLSKKYISAEQANGLYQRILIPEIKNGAFFHFSMKTETQETKFDKIYERVLTFYINGTKVAGPITSNIGGKSTNEIVDKVIFTYHILSTHSNMFTLRENFLIPIPPYLGTTAFFSVGDPIEANQSIRGWFDELRVYEFSSVDANKKFIKVPSFFEEIICNQAYGSLIAVKKVEDQLNFSKHIERAFQTATTMRSFQIKTPFGRSINQYCPDERYSNKPDGSIGEKLPLEGNRDGSGEEGREGDGREPPEGEVPEDGSGIGYLPDGCPITPIGEMPPLNPNYTFLAPPNSPIPIAGDPIVPTTLVCEQMNIGGGSVNDFSDSSSGLCATTTHRLKNALAAERCYRERVLEIHKKPLRAGKPRPDFSNVKFCISCHQNNPLPSLGAGALSSQSVLREKDTRRQPLDISRKLGGCAPDIAPFSFAADKRCDYDGFLMDYIFDFNKKIE